MRVYVIIMMIHTVYREHYQAPPRKYGAFSGSKLKTNFSTFSYLLSKMSVKWNAAGTPKERQNFCGAGTHSEQECVLLRMRECVLLKMRERVPLRTYGSRRDCEFTAC